MTSGKLKIQSGMVVAAVVGIAVVYSVCAFFPKMRAISAVRREIREKQNFVSQTAKLRPIVAQQSAELQATSQYVRDRRERLASPKQLSHVFGSITKLAKDAGMTTTRFEPRPRIAFDSFGQVPVIFGVTGSPTAIQGMLAEIERLPYTLWIDSLKMDAVGEDSENVRCQIELAIFVDNREISN